MLTAAELSSYRAQQLEALPELAVIGDRTTVSDGLGGETVAYVDRPAPVAARVGNVTDRDVRVLGSRYNGAALATVTLPHDTGVKEADRVTVGGRTFYVVHAPPVGSWATARRIVVSE